MLMLCFFDDKISPLLFLGLVKLLWLLLALLISDMSGFTFEVRDDIRAWALTSRIDIRL